VAAEWERRRANNGLPVLHVKLFRTSDCPIWTPGAAQPPPGPR
jgi:hypothetical protein